MGLRFRKTINLGGGLKFNVNAKSVSLSAGVPGARVTYNSRGQRTTSVGVPGTGLSYRTTRTVGTSNIWTKRRAKAPRQRSAWVYPMSKDEPKLAKAIIRRLSKDPDALRPWLTHHELGQAANVFMGAALFAMGRQAEALDRFDEALAEPPVPYSEGFFERYPVPVPFKVWGVTTTFPMSRSVAAIYAAIIYQMNRDSEQAMQAITQAEPSELVTAMKSSYAFNLERYDEVLHITQWTPNPAETPLEAFALILRGCAIREMGKPAESAKVISGAIWAASGVPDIKNRLNFEIGCSYAAQGNVAAARDTFILLHRLNPDFPGLDEAMAALPSA